MDALAGTATRRAARVASWSSSTTSTTGPGACRATGCCTWSRRRGHPAPDGMAWVPAEELEALADADGLASPLARALAAASRRTARGAG